MSNNYYEEKRTYGHPSRGIVADSVTYVTDKRNRRQISIYAGIATVLLLWYTLSGSSTHHVSFPSSNSDNAAWMLNVVVCNICDPIANPKIAERTTFLPPPIRSLRQPDDNPKNRLPAARKCQLPRSRQCRHIRQLQIPPDMQHQQSRPPLSIQPALPNTRGYAPSYVLGWTYWTRCALYAARLRYEVVHNGGDLRDYEQIPQGYHHW